MGQTCPTVCPAGFENYLTVIQWLDTNGLGCIELLHPYEIDKEQTMPYDDSATPPWCECPCCGIRCEGKENIQRDFGYRTMSNGQTIPQSYCRECRSARCEAGKPCKK